MWRVCRCEQINEKSNSKNKRVTQTVTRLVCVGRSGASDKKNANQSRHGPCDAFVGRDQIIENSNRKNKRVTQTVTRLVCVGRSGARDAQTRIKRVTDHVTRLFVADKIFRKASRKQTR